MKKLHFLLYIGIALFLFSFRENCDAQFSSDLNYAYDQYQSTLLSCQNYGIGKANCQTEANYAYNWKKQTQRFVRIYEMCRRNLWSNH